MSIKEHVNILIIAQAKLRAVQYIGTDVMFDNVQEQMWLKIFKS